VESCSFLVDILFDGMGFVGFDWDGEGMIFFLWRVL